VNKIINERETVGEAGWRAFGSIINSYNRIYYFYSLSLPCTLSLSKIFFSLPLQWCVFVHASESMGGTTHRASQISKAIPPIDYRLKWISSAILLKDCCGTRGIDWTGALEHGRGHHVSYEGKIKLSTPDLRPSLYAAAHVFLSKSQVQLLFCPCS